MNNVLKYFTICSTAAVLISIAGLTGFYRGLHFGSSAILGYEFRDSLNIYNFRAYSTILLAYLILLVASFINIGLFSFLLRLAAFAYIIFCYFQLFHESYVRVFYHHQAINDLLIAELSVATLLFVNIIFLSIKRQMKNGN